MFYHVVCLLSMSWSVSWYFRTVWGSGPQLKKQTNNQCVVAPAAEIRIRGSDLVTLMHRCCGCSPNIIILSLWKPHIPVSLHSIKCPWQSAGLQKSHTQFVHHVICSISVNVWSFFFFFYLIEFKELIKSLSELNLHLKESCDTFCVSFFSFYSFFIN